MKSSANQDTANSVREVKLSQIVAGNYNQRKIFDEQTLRELSENILQYGVLQPVLLRKKGKKYEIVYGERRFRAAQMAGLSAIPANIRELSDEQALEISVIENLQRENIKPIEEAAGFIALLETKKYDYAALAQKIGKSEAYVRNRVKLIDLISEIAEMIDREEINIGIGLCVAAYPEETQRDVYENHLRSKNYSWWGNLSTKEFKSDMENAYSLLLEYYRFDQSDCVHCPHNTNTYNIFPDRSGKCTGRSCFIEKNSDYIVREAVRIANEEHIRYVRVEHTNNVVNTITERLENEGLIFPMGLSSVYCPEAPEKPIREEFEDEEDYLTALDSFTSEYEYYEEEKAFFDGQLAVGNFAKCIKISRNNITTVYLEERKQEEQTSHNEEDEEKSDTQDIQEEPAHSVDNSVQIRKLRQQDERNREIVIEHTLDDAKQLIRNLPQYSGKLSDLEIRMMYFFMLSSVSKDNERILIPNKDFATIYDRLNLVDNLTEENTDLIVREYLRVNFHQQVYRGSAFADRFLAFVHQHCPESLAEVSQKYNDIYEKRKKRIDEQIAEWTTPTSEPCNTVEPIEQAAPEEMPDVPEPFLSIEETEWESSEELSDVSANDDPMLEVA